MSGKKRPVWGILLLGLVVTAAVDMAGVLLVTLLTVRGMIGEERAVPLLAAAALASSFAGGCIAKTGKLGVAGTLANSALFGVLLVLLGYGIWDGVTVQGLPVLVMVLLGGFLSWLAGRKVGKRPGKRLVKSNKKLRKR